MNELLIAAARQYRHNNTEGFVLGYDKELTDNLVGSLCNRIKELQARPNTDALPVITDEIWVELNETCLLTWKDGKPHWTQTAVDFICCLKN